MECGRTSSRFSGGQSAPGRLGNPAVWLFLDGRGGPSVLSRAVRDDRSQRLARLAQRRKPRGDGEHSTSAADSRLDHAAGWIVLGPSGARWPGGRSPGSVRSTARSHARGRIVDAHPGGPDGVGWPSTLVSGEPSSGRCSTAGARSRSAHAVAAQGAIWHRQPGAFAMAYGVTEGTMAATPGFSCAAIPRNLATKCRAAGLELFGGQPVPADAGSGRLQLAEWLVRSGQSAGRPSDGQSHLAASFRQGAGAVSQRFWHARPAAHASRAARLAGRPNSSSGGWSIKCDAPPDDALGRLSQRAARGPDATGHRCDPQQSPAGVSIGAG